MTLRWTDEALQEIVAISTYVARESESAAFVIADRIFSETEALLPNNPMIGRTGRVNGTRELIVHKSYIVVYTIVGGSIVVLTVRHTARLWPESF